jgi:hypothetical protein
MGCSHSKTQENYPWDANDFLSYSAGWQWTDTKPTSDVGYCTIMTYEGFGYGLTYERVAYFSNPDITYTGDSTNPTGDADDGDNARTIREMKLIYEAYRESVIPSGPDWDDDGLPNDWEKLYFGNETVANPTNIAANGVNTVMETYIAGISPIDPDAFFEASLSDASGFIVSWHSTSGRVYSVFGTTNLSQSFQPLETGILGPRSSWTDTVERAGSFYHVDVDLAE